MNTKQNRGQQYRPRHIESRVSPAHDYLQEFAWIQRVNDPLRFRAWMRRVNGFQTLVNVIYGDHGLPNKY